MKTFLRRVRQLLLKMPIGPLNFFVDIGQSKKISYSSYGEDMLVSSLLTRYRFLTGKELRLSYLDIGAYLPRKHNNTFFMYKRGFRGTVVEPNPELIKFWRYVRPGDNVLPVACSNEPYVELQLFDSFAESNSGSSAFLDAYRARFDLTPNRTVKVQSKTLDELIDIHLKKHQGEFILDIDIEGFDLHVLKAATFSTGKPTLILVEDFSRNFEGSDISRVLRRLGYCLISRGIISSLYLRIDCHLSHVLATDLRQVQ